MRARHSLYEETNMPIVDHNNAPEVPWRPNYRKWMITQDGDGTTSTEAAISEVGAISSTARLNASSFAREGLR